MALKPRYKKTEFGEVPEDWSLDELNCFWTVTDCKHVTAPFVRVGYPLASIRETQSRFLDFSEANCTTKDYYLRMIDGGRKPESGDLIFSRNATVGEVAQVLHERPLFAMGQDVCLIRKRNQEYSSDFFQYLLKSPLIAKQIADAMVGSTFKRMNVAQIKSLKVLFPPAEEQHRIASVLSEMDSQISAIEELIAKSRDVRAGAMHRLLTGESRLPGFIAPWEKRLFGDYVIFLKNGVQSRAQLTLSDPIRYLHYGDIHVAQGLHLSLHEAEMPRLPSLEAARLSRLEDGDLVFVDASEDLAGVGKSLEIVSVEGIEAVAGQHTIAARFDKDVLADGFKGYLQHIPAFTTHLRRLAAGTKVYATNRKHIASAEILLPEPDEQRAIVRVLSDMDAEITALEARLEKTRALKQGMMQALLTGRVRLPVQAEALDALEVAHA